MARRSRIHYPGAIYHAMARGVDGRSIFNDDRDREYFLSILSRLREETGFSMLAYCLMGNHFHLAIKISDIPLSSVLQRLLTQYALTFNTKYDRMGHLFQARFRAQICLDDRYLVGLVRYIHLNPVRASMVSHPTQWKWSSHRDYLGSAGSVAVDKIPLRDALNCSDIKSAYLDLIAQSQTSFDPWLEESPPAPTLIRRETGSRQTIDEIAEKTSVEFSISIEVLRNRGRQRIVASARKRLLKDAVNQGHALSSVAHWLGCTPGTAHVLAYGRRHQMHQKPDAGERRG
jgi:putative transposase